jgi:glycine cleavage system H protein
MATEELHYQRSRFATRLYPDRLYTAGHYWLRREADGLWRVGLAKFAVRMLGEAVEMEFEAKPGAALEVGQVVGWIEGFKAVSDLYSPIAGRFERGNPDLEREIGLLQKDAAGRGWLFEVRGEPGKDAMDARAYTAVLDATIDKMLGGRHDGAPEPDDGT